VVWQGMVEAWGWGLGWKGELQAEAEGGWGRAAEGKEVSLEEMVEGGVGVMEEVGIGSEGGLQAGLGGSGRRQQQERGKSRRGGASPGCRQGEPQWCDLSVIC